MKNPSSDWTVEDLEYIDARLMFLEEEFDKLNFRLETIEKVLQIG